MAWNIHWKIPFMSYSGVEYTLNILDEDYNSTPITLIGASNPFETQEEGGDDLLSPIRFQTGYVRVVTTDSSLSESIMPEHNMQRRVELWNGQNLMWRGFLSPKEYTQPNIDYTYELAFAVQSVLSAFKSVDFTDYYGEVKTLREIIMKCFELAGLTLDTDAYLYVCTEFSDIISIMNMKIACSIFFRLETIVNNNTPVLVTKYSSCYDVLSEILRPFGLTMRESLGDYYIVSLAYLNSRTYVTRYRYNITSNTLSNPSTYGVSAIPSANLASDNSTESIHNGAKEVEVELTVDKNAIIDTGEPEVPYSSNALSGGYILDTYEESGQQVTKKVGYMCVQPVDYPSSQRRELWVETMYAMYQSFTKRRVSGDITWTNTQSTDINDIINSSGYVIDTLTHIEDTPDLFGEAGYIGACLCRFDKASTKSEINLEPGLLVNMNSAYRMAVYYSSTTIQANDLIYMLESVESYSLSSGYIDFDIRYYVLEYYERGYSDDINGANIKIFVGNTEVSHHHHITSPLSGKISIKIYGGNDYPFDDKPRTVVISSMRLYWSPDGRDVTASRESSNHYRLLINRNFEDSKSITLNIGTNNHNEPSISMLLNSNDEYVDTVSVINGNTLSSLRPEMYIVQLMQRIYTNTQKSIERTYRFSNILSVITIPTVFSGNNKYFVRMFKKIKWVDDMITMKFIQTTFT